MVAVTGPGSCSQCGGALAPGLLSCPSCGHLVHAGTLAKLAAQAESAEQVGDVSAALTSWRDVLELLPADSRQYAVIAQRIQVLSGKVDEGAAAPGPSAWRKGAAGAGGVAALLFKFKALLIPLLTKGKFLLLGLTKLPTLLSMLTFFAVYWAAWGWKFGLAVVLSIYIHEMGHVWMMRRYGIRSTAPMFIPFFGAFVRSRQPVATRLEAARVGLAGPLWGMAAAGAAYGLYALTEDPFWGAVARLGGVINLFNLIPIWQLDGGHGVQSLTRGQRWLVAVAAGGMYYFTSQEHAQNVFLLILLFCAVFRAAFGEAPKTRDDFGLFQFVLLILILGALAAIDLPSLRSMPGETPGY
jgi:Zn-dependent protease